MDEERKETRHDIAIRLLATHAHNFRQEIEDFLDHREDWDIRGMKRIARDLLDGRDLQDVMKLIQQWDRAGFKPNGGADDTFTMMEKGKMVKTSSKKIQDEFENMCSVGLARLLEKLPANIATYMRSHNTRVKDIDLRFYSDGTSIFNHGFENSMTRIVLGKKGAGKSSFAANYILSDDVGAGMLCVGNMRMANQPELNKKVNEVGLPCYVYADTLSKTLLAVCENGLNGFHTSRAYDEPQTSHPRTTATSRKYLTQKNIFLTNRKLGMCDLAILQRRVDVPSELRDLCDIVITKPRVQQKSYVDITIRGHTEFYTGAKDTRRRRVELEAKGLPVFDYDTDWLSVFDIDFEYDEFYVFLRKTMGKMVKKGGELSRMQYQTIKNFIEGMDLFEITDEMRARVYLDMAKRLKLTLREVERRVGWKHPRLVNWAKKLDAKA